MEASGNTGREYLRVSKVGKSGRTCSEDEQHADNERAAADRGVTLGDPYLEDRAISASRYSGRVRGGFQRLLADLRSGEFAADELWIWESSRGSRKVDEWVDLLNACEEHDIRIYVTTHQRAYDPTNPRDRRSLLEDAVDGEYEVGKTSQRTKRTAAATAAKGLPHARAGYGFARKYDPQTRRLLEQHEVPEEAANVRELFKRLNKGHTLRSIADDWGNRGIRRRDGKPFTRQDLRNLATRHSYAGRRVHQQRDAKGRKIGKPTIHKASWDPIVSPALFDQVQRRLSAPERKTSRPGRAVHLLSMIAICDVCDGPLAAAFRRGRWSYWCHLSGHVIVPRDDLDKLAEKVILSYLSRDDVYEALSAAEPDGARIKALRDRLEAARTQLDELRDAVARRQATVASLVRAEPQMEQDIADLEAKVWEESMPPALIGLIEPGKDVAMRWADAPMSTRREVARMLLTPQILGQLRITRGPGAGRQPPIEQRVAWLTNEGRIDWQTERISE